MVTDQTGCILYSIWSPEDLIDSGLQSFALGKGGFRFGSFGLGIYVFRVSAVCRATSMIRPRLLLTSVPFQQCETLGELKLQNTVIQIGSFPTEI